MRKVGTVVKSGKLEQKLKMEVWEIETVVESENV